jgi:hypothetical protein
MNNNTDLMTEPYGLRYWVAQTLRTRRFGRTYVHAGARAAAFSGFRAHMHDDICISYTSYGRSL